MEEATVTEVVAFPLRSHARAMELALQQDHLQRLSRKSRLSHADQQLKSLDQAYGAMLQTNFGIPH